MSLGRAIRPVLLAAAAVTLVTTISPAPPARAYGLFPSYLESYPIAYPHGIAIRSNGESYAVSTVSRRVEHYAKSGTHLGGWGNQGSGPGQFQSPYGIAVNAAGEVYVVDAALHRMQKFSATGAYLGVIGSQGSGNGQFDNPVGVAVDASGNVYVADTWNDRIQKFDSAMNYLGQWGSLGTADGQFTKPHAIAVDALGNVYVADTEAHRIQKFSSSGAFLLKWGSSGTGDGQFAYPFAIAVDAGGNVYVTDTSNHRVQRFTSAGVFVSKWGAQGSQLGMGTGEFMFPQGIAVSADGDVHVADTNNHRVQIFRSREGSSHEYLLAWGSLGLGNGQFNDPRGVAVAPDGSVFVADKLGCRMQKFTTYGAWMATWGSSGSGNGEFGYPTGVAVDAAGSVYVTDNWVGRVQKFTGGGVYVSQWGSSGSNPGQFTGMWDIAIDAADNVYVVDAHRVQKFTTAGAFVTAWACPNAAGIGTDAEGNVYVACLNPDNVVRKYDSSGTFLLEWGGAGFNPGKFNNPTDVVVDQAGYVYVSESGNRIQQFSPRGGYIREWGETGSALRQLNSPQMMAVDASGNLFVSEASNYRVQKFASPPQLLSVVDVPNDQGGWVQLTFTRTSAEAVNSGANLTTYDFHRVAGFVWAPLGSVPVYGGPTTFNVPTAANATPNAANMGEFRVWVQLAVGGTFPPNGTLFGYSVDNLAPAAPSPFTGAYVAGATHLHWGVNAAADFSVFRLYRDTSPGFTPSPATLIATTSDTGSVDVGIPGRYYKVVAVDVNGNPSPASLVGPGQTVSAPGEAPLAFALEEVRPNPLRNAPLVVRFALPSAAKARIELLDVGGRSVSAQNVTGAGFHTLKLNPGGSLPAGVYFVRLSQGRDVGVRRVVVLD